MKDMVTVQGSTINIMDSKKTNNLFIPTARSSNYGMKLLKVN